jgi:hypothetical protein
MSTGQKPATLNELAHLVWDQRTASPDPSPSSAAPPSTRPWWKDKEACRVPRLRGRTLLEGSGTSRYRPAARSHPPTIRAAQVAGRPA